MKNVGIWLDKRQAKLVWMNNGVEKFENMLSDVEEFHVTGGSGTRMKGGPQDVVQDSKYTERQKHQLRLYFDALAEKVEDAEAIMVFGPGLTVHHLIDYWETDYPKLRDKVLAIQKADSMTDNQVKAKVRSFFEVIA